MKFDSIRSFVVSVVSSTVAVCLVGLVASSGQGASATSFPWPVNPDTIKGLTLWLDASDMDADGVYTNNPADGSSVSSWMDKSGNAHDAAVVKGQNVGTFVGDAAQGINGQPAVRFDRVNDAKGTVLRVPEVDIRPTRRPNVTIFSVYRPRNVVANNGVWGADNGGWDRFFLSYHPAFGNGKTDGLASLGPSQRGATVEDAGVSGVVRLLTVVYDGAVRNGVNSGPVDGSAVYFNGKLVRRFTDSSHPTDAQTSFAIGWDGDNSVFDGDIAEVLIYDRVLTDEEIRDVNHYFSGKYSFAIDSPKTVPGKATNLSAVCDASSMTVSFTPGASGKPAVSNYEYSLNGGRTWTPFAPAAVSSPVVISGLVSGVEHNVVLRAVNEVGPAEASESATCIHNPPPTTLPAQPTVPDAPLNLAVSELVDMVQVVFDEGGDGGSPITHYQYSIDGGAWRELSPAETSSPVVFDSLKPGKTYRLRLRAVNIVGPGAASDEVVMKGPDTEESERIEEAAADEQRDEVSGPSSEQSGSAESDSKEDVTGVEPTTNDGSASGGLQGTLPETGGTSLPALVAAMFVALGCTLLARRRLQE